MAFKSFIFDGTEFVPNKYDAIFTKDGVHSDFHFSQDLLLVSEVGYAMVNP